jgi:hypothetical protein
MKSTLPLRFAPVAFLGLTACMATPSFVDTMSPLDASTAPTNPNNPNNPNNANGNPQHAPQPLLCHTCSQDSDCGGAGNFCVGDPSGVGVCGAACSTDSDCDAKYACYGITDSNNAIKGNNCLPRDNASCFVGALPDSGVVTPPPDSGVVQNPVDSGVVQNPVDSGVVQNPTDSGMQQPPPDAGFYDSGVPPDSGIQPLCTTDTWGNFAQGFFSNYCSGCHGWATDFNSISSDSASIRSRIASGNMPRGTTLDSATQSRVLKWLDCNLPM